MSDITIGTSAAQPLNPDLLEIIGRAAADAQGAGYLHPADIIDYTMWHTTLHCVMCGHDITTTRPHLRHRELTGRGGSVMRVMGSAEPFYARKPIMDKFTLVNIPCCGSCSVARLTRTEWAPRASPQGTTNLPASPAAEPGHIARATPPASPKRKSPEASLDDLLAKL